MSELNRTERLQPSLLDRLTDLAPDRRKESLDEQVLTGAQLRRAVLRDLGWLLNTTSLDAVEDLPDGSLAARSTINYGLTSLAGQSAGGREVKAIEAAVAEAIRRFEPRIRADTVQVRARPIDREAGLPVLRLEISGELWAQPLPQQLFLETAIELDTRTAVVTDAKARP